MKHKNLKERRKREREKSTKIEEVDVHRKRHI